MKRVSSALLSQLDLEASTIAESRAVRRQLPPEPGWEKIGKAAKTISSDISHLLQSGYAPYTQQVAAIRKHRGIRPAPYWHPYDRIVYRALASIVAGNNPVKRGTEEYIAFVTGPIRYSLELQAKTASGSSDPFTIINSEIEYVVKSDATAFYQYIDHGILQQELIGKGADFEATEHLMELLLEVQGRAFGLPQMLDPSDDLSEIYIDRVEREMIRSGYAVWRFNDDFRIACRTFGESLQSIEALDAAMRRVGLTVSELKTSTNTFFHYLSDTTQKPPADGDTTLTLEDVEVAAGDYSDDFSDDPEAAAQVIRSARTDTLPEVGINLKSMDSDDIRLLQRALNSLNAAGRNDVTKDTVRLIAFVPSMTPTVVRYLETAYSVDPAAAVSALDEIIELTSLNDWQRIWLLYLIRQLKALDSAALGSAPARADWAANVRETSTSSIAKASATLALSDSDRLTFAQVIEEFETTPGALSHFALAAIRTAYDRANEKSNTGRLKAISRSSVFFDVLLAQ